MAALGGSGRVLGCLPLLSGPHGGSPGQSLVGTHHFCPGKTLSLQCWAEVAPGPPQGQQCLTPGAVSGAVSFSGCRLPCAVEGFPLQKSRRAAGGAPASLRAPCTLQRVWGRYCQASGSLCPTCAVTSHLLLCPPPLPWCPLGEPCRQRFLSQARHCAVTLPQWDSLWFGLGCHSRLTPVPSQTNVEVLTPVPVNVTILGRRPFADVMR